MIRKRNTTTSEVLAKQKLAESFHLKYRSFLRTPFIWHLLQLGPGRRLDLDLQPLRESAVENLRIV